MHHVGVGAADPCRKKEIITKINNKLSTAHFLKLLQVEGSDGSYSGGGGGDKEKRGKRGKILTR